MITKYREYDYMCNDNEVTSNESLLFQQLQISDSFSISFILRLSWDYLMRTYTYHINQSCNFKISLTLLQSSHPSEWY